MYQDAQSDRKMRSIIAKEVMMLTFAIVILTVNPSALVAHPSVGGPLTLHGPNKYLTSLGLSERSETIH